MMAENLSLHKQEGGSVPESAMEVSEDERDSYWGQWPWLTELRTWGETQDYSFLPEL